MKSMSFARKEIERINCVRKYQPHPLQRHKSHASYWNKQIEKLEKKIRFPDCQKLECLRNVFSQKEIDDVIQSGIQVYTLRNKYESFYLKRKKPTTSAKIKRVPVRRTKKPNPFIEFMKKSKQDACFWHEKPPLKIEDTPILERADIIENKIVKEFMEQFGDETRINEDIIWSIFEVTCPYPICNAVHVTDKIYESMPDTTTKYLGCPQCSYYNKVKRQIRKDIKANKQPPIKTAFGSRIPPEMRRQPPKESLTYKWENIETGHEDIETFAKVFKNITDLESTRKFCMHLLQHPEITPPAFLKDKGLLVKNMMKKPVYLGNLEEKLENRRFSDLLHMTRIKEKKATPSVMQLNQFASGSFSIDEKIFDINVLLV